jgi:hypothetical protein
MKGIFKKFLLIPIIFLLLGIILSKESFATAPILTNVPSEIIISQEFTVDASFSGLLASRIYRLRIAFSKEGQTSYFGETWNGTTWYSAESPINYSQFYIVTTDMTGSWSGQVKGRVSYGIQNFDGTLGTYTFKIGRYTEAGTSATWSTPIQVQITEISTPTITPTDIPQVTPTAMPTSTATPTSVITLTSTPTASPKSTPTEVPLITPSVIPTIIPYPTVNKCIEATKIHKPTITNIPKMPEKKVFHHHFYDRWENFWRSIHNSFPRFRL